MINVIDGAGLAREIIRVTDFQKKMYTQDITVISDNYSGPEGAPLGFLDGHSHDSPDSRLWMRMLQAALHSEAAGLVICGYYHEAHFRSRRAPNPWIWVWKSREAGSNVLKGTSITEAEALLRDWSTRGLILRTLLGYVMKSTRKDLTVPLTGPLVDPDDYGPEGIRRRLQPGEGSYSRW